MAEMGYCPPGRMFEVAACGAPIISDEWKDVAKDLLVFQAVLRGGAEVEPVEPDYRFWETEAFERPGLPRLHFIENRFSGDATNWWIPNRACAEAMLRSAGFEILDHPEAEVFICRRMDVEVVTGR